MTALDYKSAAEMLRFCADAIIRNKPFLTEVDAKIGDGDHGIDFCLALCAWLREVTPHCRLMLMCPEGQPEAVSRAIEAKRRGEIDDFVFYDVSLDYLAASLQSL